MHEADLGLGARIAALGGDEDVALRYDELALSRLRRRDRCRRQASRRKKRDPSCRFHPGPLPAREAHYRGGGRVMASVPGNPRGWLFAQAAQSLSLNLRGWEGEGFRGYGIYPRRRRHLRRRHRGWLEPAKLFRRQRVERVLLLGHALVAHHGATPALHHRRDEVRINRLLG